METYTCPFFDSGQYAYVKQSDYVDHRGQDLQGTNNWTSRNAYGVPVLAPCDLEIQFAGAGTGSAESYGNWVRAIIKSDYQSLIGWQMRVAHFDSLNISEGAFIRKGGVLGIQGNTGNCSKDANGVKYVHIHVELLPDGSSWQTGRNHLESFTGVPLRRELAAPYKNNYHAGGMTNPSNPGDGDDDGGGITNPPGDNTEYEAATAEYNRLLSIRNQRAANRDSAQTDNDNARAAALLARQQQHASESRIYTQAPVIVDLSSSLRRDIRQIDTDATVLFGL